MRISDTARKTGNQAFGFTKIADRANAVQMSVTKVALIRSLPTWVAFRPRSTSTAYTTAREVVERAVPAMSDALTVQPRRRYETSDAATNGPAKDETPMPREAGRRRRR
jgi:hypothetical protein